MTAIEAGGRYKSKRLLVVVKTYPNPSQTYGETVCVAAVDLETSKWVRVYPITFRRLADRRFDKFQEITCEATRPRDDNRPESIRVNQDTITLVRQPIQAEPAWRRRMSLLPKPDASLEAIQSAQRRDGTSLGMFRPREVKRLVIKKRTAAQSWNARQRAYLSQQRLGLGEATARNIRELEQIPWTFSYEFTCDDSRCKTWHTIQIIDWEIGESYRKWSKLYGDQWEDKLRQRYERELPARDLHLVVGNLAKRRHTFVIIGLVRPPRPKVNGRDGQLRLDFVSEERPVAGVRVGLEAQEADSSSRHDGDEGFQLFPDES